MGMGETSPFLLPRAEYSVMSPRALMHTIHLHISVLIAPKPGLCIKKYIVQVFRSGGEVSLLYSGSRSELFAS